MSNYGKLPRGIVNKNPGNLRGGWRSMVPTEHKDGFAVFKTYPEGLANLLRLIDSYYTSFKLHTAFAFLAKYAPPTENDLESYMRGALEQAGWGGNDPKLFDLRLDLPENRLKWAKAIVVIENGHPPRSWPAYPVWFTDGDWATAVRMMAGPV